jgi:hypothetical protein
MDRRGFRARPSCQPAGWFGSFYGNGKKNRNIIEIVGMECHDAIHFTMTDSKC